MRFNLRKANAIQQEIQSALREIPVISNVQITEFEDPDTAIESARARNAETRDARTRTPTLGSLEAFQEILDRLVEGEELPTSNFDHVAPGSDLDRGSSGHADIYDAICREADHAADR